MWLWGGGAPILTLSKPSLPTPLGPRDSDLSSSSLQGLWGGGRRRLGPERATGLPDSVEPHCPELGSWGVGVGTHGGAGRGTAGRAGGDRDQGPPSSLGTCGPRTSPGGGGVAGGRMGSRD